MKEDVLIPEEIIMNKILLIRGERVLIDSDLASLYGVPTKRLNEQVKRNIKRFPRYFMFELTKEEKEEVVAHCDHLKKLKYSSFLPNAFTHYGILQAANILNSDRAIVTSNRIIEVFIQMREMLVSHKDITATARLTTLSSQARLATAYRVVYKNLPTSRTSVTSVAFGGEVSTHSTGSE